MTAAPPSQPTGAERAEGLLQILVCPACHSRLVADVPASELICTNPQCGLAFPVTEDGIPVLLVDEARATRPVADPAPDPATAPAADGAGPPAAVGAEGAAGAAGAAGVGKDAPAT